MVSEIDFLRRYRYWLYVQSGGGLVVLTMIWGRASDASTFALVSSWASVSIGSLLVIGSGLHGWADAVTATRAVLFYLWLGWSSPDLYWSAALAAILALDLVDGWVARRRDPNATGAIYDMETDQLVVLGLAYQAHRLGLPGWVLILPGLKYLSVLVTSALVLPLGDPKPVHGDNRRARVIYVLVLVSLWVAVTAGAHAAATALLAVAGVSLAFSFAGDLRFLLAGNGNEPTEAL